MRHIPSLFLALVLGLGVTPQAWGGMAVTDSGSYAYYAEQIEHMTDQIKLLQEQLAEITSVKEALTGNYSRAASMIRSLQRRLERMLVSPTALLQYVEDLALDEDDYLLSDGSVDMEALLEEVYHDPRFYPADSFRAYQLEQTALKATITDCEAALAEIEDRMTEIDELTAEIDATVNEKDALDLNNRFLAEILTTLQEQLVLLARIGSGQALQDYKGVDADAYAAHLEGIYNEDRGPDSAGSFLRSHFSDDPFN